MKEEKNSVILIFIFILAILIRIYNDPLSPYHYDPGKNIVYSRAIVDSFPLFPQYNQYFNLGEYYEYQSLFPYIVALLYKITGFSLVTLTSQSIIIIGSIMTITVYLLSKEIFDNVQIALISAGLIAVSKVQLMSYVNYYPQITALTILPLAFVFLIRYVNTSDKKYIIYVSILSTLIILSSYLTAIVYIPILALSLIIYTVTKQNLKYVYVLISITVGTLALLTFYILPIINRYGIDTFVVGIRDAIFKEKEVPFTNAPIEVLMSAFFKFTIVIVLIIFVSAAIYIVSRISKLELSKLTTRITLKNIKYEHILLFTWILISFVLVISYKFRPILWVDRYLEFFDVAACIVVGYSIYFILSIVKRNKYLSTNYKPISIFVLMLIFSYPIYDIARHNYKFGYWNTPNDLEALNWVQGRVSSESLFVTTPGIGSFWVSALGGVHVLGGESSQILGAKFDGNSYSATIINSPNVEEKMNLIRKFGVQYIYLPIRPFTRSLLWKNEYSVEGLKAFENPKYFEFVYHKEDDISSVYIIKVKEDLIPQYNVPKIDKNITIFGYLVSIVTLIVMIRLITRENVEEYNKKKTGKRSRTLLKEVEYW